VRIFIDSPPSHLTFPPQGEENCGFSDTLSVFLCIDFDFLSRFLEGLQKFLGDKCEIVIHDYRKGYDNSLVYEITY
jgi:hypothetical protein